MLNIRVEFGMPLIGSSAVDPHLAKNERDMGHPGLVPGQSSMSQAGAGEFLTGIGCIPDGVEAILRSRLGRNYWQLPAGALLREKPCPADIVCFKRYRIFGSYVRGGITFFGKR